MFFGSENVATYIFRSENVMFEIIARLHNTLTHTYDSQDKLIFCNLHV